MWNNIKKQSLNSEEPHIKHPLGRRVQKSEFLWSTSWCPNCFILEFHIGACWWQPFSVPFSNSRWFSCTLFAGKLLCDRWGLSWLCKRAYWNTLFFLLTTCLGSMLNSVLFDENLPPELCAKLDGSFTGTCKCVAHFFLVIFTSLCVEVKTLHVNQGCEVE